MSRLGLRREVPMRRWDLARRRVVGILVPVFWSVSAIALPIALIMPEGRRITVFGDSKTDIARMQIKEYADEALLHWRRNNAGIECPRRLAALNEYTNRHGDDIHDPWGNEIRMTCDRRGFFVWSLGEDGRPGTSDDITYPE